MTTNEQTTITLPDGRVFPQYKGQALSWNLGLYNTWNEEQAGYPRMRAVIRAMMRHRPDQVRRERYEMLGASFDRMFGMNAKKVLAVIEDETKKAEQKAERDFRRAFTPNRFGEYA